MATLDLQINPSQAVQAAATFQKVLEDIKRAVNGINDLTFSNVSQHVNKIVTNIGRIGAAIENVITSLGTMHYALQSIAASPHLTTLRDKFIGIRDVIREMRADLKGFETAVGGAARAAGRMQPRASTTSPSSSTSTSTTAAPAMTTALVRVDQRVAQATQVRAAEEAFRQKEMADQGSMLMQVSQFQRERVTGAEAVFQREEMLAQQNMMSQIAAEQAKRQQYAATVALRKEQLGAVSAFEETTRKREMADQAAMFPQLRAFQAARAHQVEAGAVAEERAAQQSMRARIVAEEMVTRAVMSEGEKRVRAQMARMGGPNFGLLPGAMASQTQTDVALEKLFVRPVVPQPPRGASVGKPFSDADIAANQRHMQQFRDSFTNIDDATEKTGKAFRSVKSEKDKVDKNMDSMSRGSLTNFYRGFQTLRILLGGFTLFALIREFRSFADELLETGRELQHTRALFMAATRDNVDEADRLRVVARNIATEFGAPLIAMEQNFGKFAGAAQGTNLQGKLLDTTFRGVASAVAVLGTGSDKATNIIKVFTDILGKGRVQSEEVVKQFGNAVPGAYRRVADALGMTTAKLTDAIQRGTLLATDVVSKVGAELGRIYEKVAKAQGNTLIGSFNNLKNAVVLFKEAILLGGAEQGFIDFFKGLTTVLSDAKIVASAREIGEAFGNVLRTALDVLGPVMTFFITNWRIIASFFVGTAVFAGIMLIVSALGLLTTAFKAAGIAAAISFGKFALIIAAISAIAGLAAYFGVFSANTDKASKEAEEFAKRQRALAEAAAATAAAYDEQSRAVIQAEGRIDKEIRTFAEDQRAAAEALDLAGRGVSTLSAQFESFGKVGERVRALVRAGTFEAFGEKANEKRIAFQQQAVALENVAMALGHVLKMQQELDKTQQEQRVSAFTTSTVREFGVGITDQAVTLQSEYDRRVIPMLEKTREILGTLTDTAQIEKMSGAFNRWSQKILESVKAMYALQVETRGLTTLAESFRDLQTQQAISRLAVQTRPGREVGPAEDPFVVAEHFVQQAITSQTQLQARLLSGGVGGAEAKSWSDAFQKALDEYQQMQKSPVERIGDAAQLFHSGAEKFNTGVDKIIGGPQAKVPTEVPMVVGGLPGSVIGGRTPEKYQALVEQEASRRRLDPELIRRIIQTESQFNPEEKSRTGAQGLMQIMPFMQKAYGVTNAFDPVQNIRAGVDIFADELKRFGGDVRLALAAYNVGAPAVVAAGRQVPDIKETQDYVKKVLEGYDITQAQRKPSMWETIGATAKGALGMNPPMEARVRERLMSGIKGMFKQEVQSDVEEILFGAIGGARTTERIVMDIVGKPSVTEVPSPTPVKPLQPPQTTAEALFEAVRANIGISPRGQLTPQAEAERNAALIRSVTKNVQELGLKWSDVADNTDKYKLAIANAVVQTQGFTEARFQQGEEYIRQLGIEESDIEQQIELLKIPPALRELEIEAIRRRNQILAQGAATTPGQKLEAEARSRIVGDTQNIQRQKIYIDQVTQSLKQNNIELHDQLTLLNVEAEYRDVAASALQKYRDIERQHLDPSREKELKAAVMLNAVLQQRVQTAQRDPIRQMIDSIPKLDLAMRVVMANAARGFSDALTEAIFNIGARLRDRNADVNRARARLQGIPFFEKEQRRAAEEDVQKAEERRASVFSTVMQPFVGLLENTLKEGLKTLIDTQIIKPLLEKVVGKPSSPEVAATQEQTKALIDAISAGSREVVDAIVGRSSLGGVPGVDVPSYSPSSLETDPDKIFNDMFNDNIWEEEARNTASTFRGVNDVVQQASIGLRQLGEEGSIASIALRLLSTSTGGGSSVWMDLVKAGVGAFANRGTGTGGGGSGGFTGTGGGGSGGFTGTEGVGSSAMGGSVMIAHSGGILGGDVFPRMHVPSSVFAYAPRFHSGGMPGGDDVPIIAQQGEGIFTKEQMKHMAPSGSNLVVNMTIVTKDADSFRKSQSQILTEVSQAVQGMNRRRGN